MRNEMLASTSSGVETVSVLEKATLDRLGRWLCQENDYHDRLESVCGRRAPDLERDDRRYETEQKANGGYCDTCRDFAGELLAQFDLRESDEERRALADKELGPF